MVAPLPVPRKSTEEGLEQEFAVLLELVKMAVGPAHCDLDSAVEATQLDGIGHLNAPPDRRGDAGECDLQ